MAGTDLLSCLACQRLTQKVASYSQSSCLLCLGNLEQSFRLLLVKIPRFVLLLLLCRHFNWLNEMKILHTVLFQEASSSSLIALQQLRRRIQSEVKSCHSQIFRHLSEWQNDCNNLLYQLSYQIPSSLKHLFHITLKWHSRLQLQQLTAL